MMRSSLRRRIRRGKILLVLLAGVWLGSARAESDAKIVAVVQSSARSPAMTEVLTRIQGELTAAGFQVVTIEHVQGADPSKEIQSTASALHPLAVVAIFGEPERSSADVWVADRSTGTTVVKHLEFEPPRGQDASSVLAVKAVEMLRASLLQILFEQLLPSPVAAPPSQPPMRDRPTEPARPERRCEASCASVWPFAVEAGVGALLSLQRVGPAFSPVLRANYEMTPWLGLRASAEGLGTTVSVKAPLGTARVSQQLALIELTSMLSSQRSVRPLLLLGLGAYRIGIDGSAPEPNRGIATSLWAVAIDAGIGARFHVSDRIAFALELDAIFTWPYPMVRIADVDAGRTGRPSLASSLTLVAWL